MVEGVGLEPTTEAFHSMVLRLRVVANFHHLLSTNSSNLPNMSILISLSLFSFHCSSVKASEPRGGLDVLKQSINFLSINLSQAISRCAFSKFTNN